ncbi:carbohydrate kinase family protein [uncultured Deinococcus sp.]|uniref:carbohydrate kinase family protein n=1 Tax=uncultured Deinococcus sp. TaxID=158789 RepID=UPI0025F69DBD|nr:carbohydrate kinase family protein [uncultured Deinococcus sp.]
MTQIVVIGNVNLDILLGPLDTWPQRGTEVTVPHMQWRAGGNAGNAALAFQGLGTAARVISGIGTDLPGQWLRTQFPDLDMQWLPVPGPTSVSVALTHPDGERTFLTHLGHLATQAWPACRAALPERPARYALVAGTFLMPALRADHPTVLADLRGAGTQVALDPAWPEGGFTPAVRAEMSGWLRHVDHLLINDLEAGHLTGQTRSEDAARALEEALPDGATVVVKCGARGVVARRLGTEYLHGAPAVTVLDTVGAGDTWNAAYLHALSSGADLPAALAFAAHTTAVALSTVPRRYVGSPPAPEHLPEHPT